MSRDSVLDISSNFEEVIERLSISLGTAKVRRQVFDIIYGRGSKPLTASDIASRLDRTGSKAQVVNDALNHLSSHYLIKRIPNDVHAAKVKWVYGKDDTVRANRKRIVALADNPNRRQKLATKRRPAIENVSLTKRSTQKHSRGQAKARVRKVKAKQRIAVLVTNPDRYASLQTGVEARDIDKAIKASKYRESFDVKAVLAPTFRDLIDQLNEYKPTILHFSGHGGGRSLVLDNREAGLDGGEVVDFDKVAKLLETTSAGLSLLFLAACDTLDGADRFLESADAVIAMSDSVDDEGASKFSEQFYRSISGGAQLNSAIEQARLVLEHEGVEDGDLPTLLVRDEKFRRSTFN